MKPLEGVRILDFTQFLAGPLSTLFLSDLGAEVIKLENPPLGDGTRYITDIVNEKSSNYTTRNRGKKSVILNLKDEKQKEYFLRLVETADAVVENFKPGTLEKFGITYDVLKERNPKIVFTSISGYGQTGPYKAHAAYDGAVQAEGGIMSVTGEMGGNPVRCGASIADTTAGMVGCIGTLSALYEARVTGKGRRVDVAMMDSMVTIMENMISNYISSGAIAKPLGNRMWTASPFRDFVCKDGQSVYIGISTDAQFKSFCEIVGHPEWVEDERFLTNESRPKHADELEALTEEALSHIDSNVLCEEMEKRKLVYGRINNVEQVVNHPQTKARNMIVEAVYQDGTTFKVPGCPIKLSDSEDKMEYSAAVLGEDTITVLAEVADVEELHTVYDDVLQECKTATSKLYQK